MVQRQWPIGPRKQSEKKADGGWHKWYLMSLIFLVALTIGVQIGIYQGRHLERQAIEAELMQLHQMANSLDKELNTYRQMAEVIRCESDGQHANVWGDGGLAYGVAQFHEATFEELKVKAGMPHLRWKNRKDQIVLLHWSLEHGYGKLWSCYNKLQLAQYTK